MKAKKIVLGIIFAIVALVLIACIAFACVFNKEISTVSSVKTITGSDSEGNKPVVSFEYNNNYYFDDFLAQGGVNSNEELINFAVNKLTRGLVNLNIEPGSLKMGCTTFSARTSAGDKLFARNYDFAQAGIAVVKTAPEGDHKSIGVVDMSKIMIKPEGNDLSLSQKAFLLLSPYACMDGINDAGLSCSILMSRQGKDPSIEESTSVGTDTQTPNIDLTATTFIRILLDKASTVEEAVAIAENIDMHEFAFSSFHYAVADAKGNSAIIEWVGQDSAHDKDGANRHLSVVYNQPGKNYLVASNCISTPNYYGNATNIYGQDRIATVEKQLSPTNGILSNTDQALSILQSVGRRYHKEFGGSEDEVTLYSCIYDLTNHKLILVDNEKFNDPDHKFVFTLD